MLNVEDVEITKIITYDRNPRKNDHAVDKIAAAIAEFGFRVPLLIQRKYTNDHFCNYHLIDGHLRLKAAQKLGMTNVPCIFVDDLSDAKIKAMRLSINKMAELAEWDEGLLALELQELREMDFNLDVIGFDLSELNNFMSNEVNDGLIDEDSTPSASEKPKSKLGDVWLCGNHKVMCGDFADDIQRNILLVLDKADMVFTDPPYNANYSSRVDEGRRKEWGGIENDNMSDDQYNKFLENIVRSLKLSINDNCSIYICIDWKSYPVVVSNVKDVFNHKSTIIWDKSHFGLGTYYRTQYEMILFLTSGDKMTWHGEHNERDVWSIDREPSINYVHPTQKPVAIPERAILNSSNVGDLVLDAFCGSGSTLIACQKTNRRCYTINIDPKYVDVAVQRWQEFTGNDAINAQTGKKFNES